MWIVSWQPEEFVRTRNARYMLVGNGPSLVDAVDQGLSQSGVVSAKTGEWEIDYRVRIRWLPAADRSRRPARRALRSRRHARTHARCADTALSVADALAGGGHRVRERAAGR
ncbi:YrhB domain-containing protein [Streptomyces sp. NPDC005426]|uniref:YrhB domain-containing protein n=1 Tax=Streptomyces sp. NPDC005426 TaxID=3155344 RepID=UPI0033AC8D82